MLRPSTPRKALQSSVVVTLVTIAAALPAPDLSGQLTSPVRREFQTLDEWCPVDVYEKAESRQNIWDGTSAGDILDNWIIGKGYDNWFDNMVQFAFGAEYEMKCDTIPDNGCTVPATCDELYEQGIGSEYWILKQVEAYNGILAKLRNDLLIEGNIINGFRSDKIVSEFFDVDNDEIEMGTALLVIGSALGMAATPIGGIGAIGGALAGGLFSTMGILSPSAEEDLKSTARVKVNEALGNSFEKMRGMLNAVHRNALGLEGGKEEDLPETLLVDSNRACDAAKFFDNGKWFLDTDNGEIDNYIQKTRHFMTLALISQMIRFSGFEVFIWDREQVDADMCKELEMSEERPTYKNARWIGDGPETGCFFITRKDDYTGTRYWGPMHANAQWTDTLTDDAYYGLKEDHDVDMEMLYRNALSCDKYDGDETQGLGEMFSDGHMPRCVWSIPVRRVKWQNDIADLYNGHWEVIEDIK